MGDNEYKANQLIADAEKKLTSAKGFFGSLFGGGSKVDEAVECYVRAANLYKMAKKWSEAGKAFCEAANLHGKLGAKHEAATNYVDAANCYKKSDTNEAVNCFMKSIDIYTDMGRFTMAAKHHQTIAELYETDATDLQKAIQHYEQAADYFKGEESNTSANKCWLKVAQYAAQLENYNRAIQSRLQDTLSVNDQHLNSVLNLVSDSIVALLVKQSVLPLVHVNDIPRFFRKTNRDPSKPSEYVNKVLQPITAFYAKNLESVPLDVLQVWVVEAFKEVSIKFYNSISEVLESAQKTEESLRRLKKMKDKSSFGTESKGKSDDDKIREQLFLDVQAYCQGPLSLQIDTNNIPMLNDLMQLVESARDKSERQ